LEGLAFSLLIVVLTNIFSLFLVAGSEEWFKGSTSYPSFVKEESVKKLSLGNAGVEKPSSKEGLPAIPPLKHYENSTSPLDCSTLAK